MPHQQALGMWDFKIFCSEGVAAPERLSGFQIQSKSQGLELGSLGGPRLGRAKSKSHSNRIHAISISKFGKKFFLI